MVAVRKYVLYGRFLSVCQFLPWVSSGLVFEGEIWTMLAEANTCCIVWATPEFSGPTAPTAVLSPVIVVALDWPVAGCALSS